MSGCDCRIIMKPPAYPDRCFPSRCRHEPQFVMAAHVQPGGRKKSIEIDHRVCLACGLSLPATHGGNVLQDLEALWDRFGWNPDIGARIIELRMLWLRIAQHLFNEDGWNGRHERIAKLIDPHLTMRIEDAGQDASGLRYVSVHIDDSYLRSAAA